MIKRKRKPGKSIPNEARHTVQRLLRLRPDEDAAVRAVATARGVPVSRAVGELALVALRFSVRKKATVLP